MHSCFSLKDERIHIHNEIARCYFKALKNSADFTVCIKLFSEYFYLGTHLIEKNVPIAYIYCLHGTHRFDI